MGSITQHQYLEMLARTQKAPVRQSSEAVEREAQLHEQIESYCKDRGWICFHSRMDKRPTNQVGTPDFIIATHDGRTFYIEAKRKGGKCTTAQNAMLAWLSHNHQRTAVVTCMDEFITAIQ